MQASFPFRNQLRTYFLNDKIIDYIVNEGLKSDRAREFGKEYAIFMTDIVNTSDYRESLIFTHKQEEKIIDLQIWNRTPGLLSVQFYSDTNNDGEVDFVVEAVAKNETELGKMLGVTPRQVPTEEQKIFFAEYLSDLYKKITLTYEVCLI